MDKRLLTILRCPVSHKGLSLLQADKLEAVNAAIAAGELVTLAGETLAAVRALVGSRALPSMHV